MKNFHELLGKRVQFYTVINGKLFECKGTVTAVLLSLEGKKEIGLGGITIWTMFNNSKY